MEGAGGPMRAMKPGEAVSLMTTQPSALALSSTALSMTVLPDPRAPVYRVARPADPGPSSRASLKFVKHVVPADEQWGSLRRSGGTGSASHLPYRLH